MTEVVIATHGYLAKGLKDSIEFILGKQEKLMAVPAYTDDCLDPKSKFKQVIAEFQNEDIVFATDVFGGSVNNDLQQLCHGRNNLHLVTGVNMPMLLQLMMSLNGGSTETAIEESVEAGKKGIVNCDNSTNQSITDFDSF